MGQQIIQQPNRLYAVWNSIADDLTLLDHTPEDIIQTWTERDDELNREKVLKIVEQLKRGEKPYYQFTRTWDEAVCAIREANRPESDTLEIIETLATKEEARRRLGCDPVEEPVDNHTSRVMWLHVPSSRVFPKKYKDVVEDEWIRVIVWTEIEDDEEGANE